ncbi:MAG: hypothetical protein DSY37_03320 [Hyperthermus sp.]|nr:MAG: hypothetical protein DSY37_03320 [Hyperthermus sp.]
MVKVLVIISSADVDKALTGLMWATNALRFKWVDDVEVLLFGPVEKMVAKGDERLVKALEELKKRGKNPVACRRIAERDGYLKDLEKYVDTEYIGSFIAWYLSKGYMPLTF